MNYIKVLHSVAVSFESFIKYSSCHVITVEFVALHVFDCLI